MKLEYLVVLDSLVSNHFGQREGENLHTWEVSIGIGITIMLVIPFLLGALLHHIVPSIDFPLVVFVEQVEGSA